MPCCVRRQRHAAAGEHRRRAPAAPARAGSMGGSMPAVEVLDMRGRHHPLHPETRMALADLRRVGRQGDSAAQPPRLVELPLLPLLRTGVAVPQLRGGPGPAPPRRISSPAITAAIASAVPSAVAPAARCRWPGTGRGPSASSTSCATRWAETAFPVFRLDADSAGLEHRAAHAAAVRARAGRACWSAPRWWPRDTTSPTSRWGSSWTPIRPCASRTSGPRSGPSPWSPSWPATDRAAGPDGGRARAGPDPGPRCAGHRLRHPS